MFWQPIVIAVSILAGEGITRESNVQVPYDFGELNATPFVQPPVEERFARVYTLAPFECSSYYEPRNALVKYKINGRFVYDCSMNGTNGSGNESEGEGE